VLAAVRGRKSPLSGFFKTCNTRHSSSLIYM
jgi:hypothetical protein